MAEKPTGDDDLKKGKKAAADGVLCYEEGAAARQAAARQAAARQAAARQAAAAACAATLEETPGTAMPHMSSLNIHTKEVECLTRELAKQRQENQCFHKKVMKLITDREKKDKLIDDLTAEINELKKKDALGCSEMTKLTLCVREMHDYWKNIYDRQVLSVEKLEREAERLRREVETEKDRNRVFCSTVLRMVEEDYSKEDILAWVRGQDTRSSENRRMEDCMPHQESLTQPEQESDTGQTQRPRYVGGAEQAKVPTVFSHRVVDVPLQSSSSRHADNKSPVSRESPESLLVTMAKVVLTSECRGLVRNERDYHRCQVLGPIFTGKFSPFPKRSVSPAPIHDAGDAVSAADPEPSHRLHSTLVVSSDIMSHDVAARLDITAEMVDTPENRFLLHPRVADAYARGHLTLHPVCSSPDQLAAPLTLRVKVLRLDLLDDAQEVADSGRHHSALHTHQGKTVTFKGIDGRSIRCGFKHSPTPRLELLALHNWFSLVSALRDNWLQVYSADERRTLAAGVQRGRATDASRRLLHALHRHDTRLRQRRASRPLSPRLRLPSRQSDVSVIDDVIITCT